MKAEVAGAPVSFGVFEMTPDGAATVSIRPLHLVVRRHSSSTRFDRARAQ